MTTFKSGFGTWKSVVTQEIRKAYRPYRVYKKRRLTAEDYDRIEAFQKAHGIKEDGHKSLRRGGKAKKITLPKLKCLESKDGE